MWRELFTRALAMSAAGASKQLAPHLLAFDLAADAAPLFRRLFDQPAQFLDRLRVVVYLQSQHCVVAQPDAAVLFDDEQSRRLHAAFVTARRLSGFERREQSQ